MAPDSSTSRPQVRLLGSPGLLHGETVDALPTKLSQLLALLGAAPDHCLSREVLADLLWDRSLGADPRANLRQLLSRARRDLPWMAAALVGSGDLVRLDPTALDIDLVHLLRLAAEPRRLGPREVLDLWRGDLLEGTDPGTAAFEDWLRAERDSSRSIWTRLATTTLADLTRYGRTDLALLIPLADQLMEVAPDVHDARGAIVAACGRIGRSDIARRYNDRAEEKVPAQARSLTPPPSSRMVAQNTSDLATTRPRLPRIAVLRPRDEATTDALFLRAFVSDVADVLSSFRSFAIMAPHSSFAFEHQDGLPTAEFRKDIDFAAMATAKVRYGRRVLAVRLVDCHDASIAWAGEFRLDEGDLADSGTRLVRRVAAHMADALERELASHLRPHSQGMAYSRYIQGREAQIHCDLPSVRRARRAFRDALTVDSSFASARARVAETLFTEWLLLGGRDGDLLAEAERTVASALRYDPNAAIVHWVSGAVALYQRAWDRVLGHFEDAETLAPHNADLLLEYADALSHLGQHDAARDRFALALDLNPRPPDHYFWTGASMALGRLDFTGAAELCDRIRSDEAALGLRAASYALAGDFSQARTWAEKIREVLPQMVIEDFVRVTPDPPESEKIRAYREGLALAGVT